MADPQNFIPIIQGQFHVSDKPDDVLSTILGSCIAACLFDGTRKVGGMNHFLLPGSDPRSGRNIKYGAHSMEELVNALLRAGAQRSRIEVQLFGGASVMSGMSGVGEMNAEFARRFVADEGFKLTGHDLGGKTGRRLKFAPATGVAESIAFDIAAAEDQPAFRPSIPPKPKGNVELF